jgi:Carboxypeptidase regulatory-like domain/TonB-dependent Receptor Plug Domain/TonB dependent receptor
MKFSMMALKSFRELAVPLCGRCLLIGILASQAVTAQVSGGVFRGEVRDASNAVVQQAKIQVRSVESGAQVVMESNGDGLYSTPTLVPGSYTLTATKDSFKEIVFGPVTLQVNQIVRVDFALAVGVRTESIQVNASGEQLLAPESADISQVIVNREVSEIPLNQRQWQTLITLSPGTTPGAPGESGSPNPVNVDGQRSKANLYLVDGISTTSSAQGRGDGFNIPLEAVREFSVQAGAYSAEYGDVAGGVINLQTKSGTNQWHGSLFEFFRNDKLDAADFFSNSTGQPKNPLRYNQFGGSAGGPIRRNKTFVFADYQGTIAHSGTPMITSLPTSQERQGDFSGLTVPIYNPFGASLARPPFPGNKIPESLIDPAVSQISAMLPQPNQFGANGQPLPFNNYAVTPPATSNFEAFDIRVDHQFSPSHSVFIRDSFQHTNADAPSIFGEPLGGSLLGAGAISAGNQNAGIGYFWQISPSLINEARIGLNRQTTAETQADYGQNLAQQFGIPGVNLSPQTSGLPTMVVEGLFNVGGSLLTPLYLASTSLNPSEKISWVKGRHILHFGFEYQHELGSTGYLVYGRGYYTFLNLTTGSLAGNPLGNAFASFLTGAPYEVLRDEFPPGLVGLISNRYGFYAQDDFKLTPRLTLNIGARYDIMPYPSEMHNRLSNFDPATGTMLMAGVNTNPHLVNTDYHDVAPRVGLAWAPGSGSTVFRAGYGIAYVDPLGGEGALNSNEFNLPFYYVNTTVQFPYTAQTYTLSQGLPALVVPSPNTPNGNQRYIDPTEQDQYSQTWSFGIQRALGRSLMAEIDYVGTSGTNLLTANDINAAPPGTTSPTTRQPFGSALGEIRELSNSAHSTYHGLQSKLEQRFSRGLYFLVSYTWSKSIDDQSNGTDTATASGQYPQDPLNPSLDRGLSSFDVPQRFVGSFVWELPFGRGRAFGSSLPGAVNGLIGGWQLSGVITAQSGSPFSVLMNCADINAGDNNSNCRPNRITSGVLPTGQRSIAEWFDTAAFAIPSIPEYGNAGRNILMGPGLQNFDLGLMRSFLWGRTETRRVQIRAEFFNTLNHTNFSLPINSIDSPAFGSITSAAPARQIQLGARVEF